MAKQTFTTGQVLTAAQMTSLQQTAMLGGAASAKTASYTLVAADAGTAISMSNASATTITVNTALFAAGDTVQITNLGAGVCTITAGTATVNTSATLALAQYESGTLDFTSTSAAIFIKGAGAAGASGSNWSLVNSGGTALTGSATVTVSGISGADQIMVIIRGGSAANTGVSLSLRFNSDSGANYNPYGASYGFDTTYTAGNFSGLDGTGSTEIPLMYFAGAHTATTSGYALIDGANSAGLKIFTTNFGTSGTSKINYAVGGFYNSASTISSVSILSDNGNFDGGTVYVYKTA